MVAGGPDRIEGGAAARMRPPQEAADATPGLGQSPAAQKQPGGINPLLQPPLGKALGAEGVAHLKDALRVYRAGAADVQVSGPQGTTQVNVVPAGEASGAETHSAGSFADSGDEARESDASSALPRVAMPQEGKDMGPARTDEAGVDLAPVEPGDRIMISAKPVPALADEEPVDGGLTYEVARGEEDVISDGDGAAVRVQVQGEPSGLAAQDPAAGEVVEGPEVIADEQNGSRYITFPDYPWARSVDQYVEDPLIKDILTDGVFVVRDPYSIRFLTQGNLQQDTIEDVLDLCEDSTRAVRAQREAFAAAGVHEAIRVEFAPLSFDEEGEEQAVLLTYVAFDHTLHIPQQGDLDEFALSSRIADNERQGVALEYVALMRLEHLAALREGLQEGGMLITDDPDTDGQFRRLVDHTVMDRLGGDAEEWVNGSERTDGVPVRPAYSDYVTEEEADISFEVDEAVQAALSAASRPTAESLAQGVSATNASAAAKPTFAPPGAWEAPNAAAFGGTAYAAPQEAETLADDISLDETAPGRERRRLSSRLRIRRGSAQGTDAVAEPDQEALAGNQRAATERVATIPAPGRVHVTFADGSEHSEYTQATKHVKKAIRDEAKRNWRAELEKWEKGGRRGSKPLLKDYMAAANIRISQYALRGETEADLVRQIRELKAEVAIDKRGFGGDKNDLGELKRGLRMRRGIRGEIGVFAYGITDAMTHLIVDMANVGHGVSDSLAVMPLTDWLNLAGGGLEAYAAYMLYLAFFKSPNPQKELDGLIAEVKAHNEAVRLRGGIDQAQIDSKTHQVRRETQDARAAARREVQQIQDTALRQQRRTR